MRAAFQNELQVLREGLMEMNSLVATALEDASKALLTGDLALAEQVIVRDQEIDDLQAELDEKSVDVLATQSPVATDLRTVVATLRMSASLERMGDLAAHIALVLRRRHPNEVIPADLKSAIETLADLSLNAVKDAGKVLDTYDVALAAVVEERDNNLDRAMDEVYAALSADDAPYSVKESVDLALLARFYERLGDHAVSVARRVVFLVTGDALDSHTPHTDVTEF
ncbi:phosphate signaling complex protein PhoU [Dermabacter sp. Marseille-Q3180]|uniref:phosphate signaling complex protein PhoU n=1 Tax=Dermabacter sp. Marseille-Q3180 TaxID=2758090 RepID=UPI00202414A3|nr:phosphate signaling complex protein PhoU [Dermabacter sp. Marseille-Q3180]